MKLSSIALRLIMIAGPEEPNQRMLQTISSESDTFQKTVRPPRTALVPTPTELLPLCIAYTVIDPEDNQIKIFNGKRPEKPASMKD